MTMNITNLDENSMANIFSFLSFKDAVKICYLNKECYITFLIFCYKYSFVSLNLNKQQQLKFSKYDQEKLYIILNEKISFDMFQILYLEKNFVDINHTVVNIYDKIKYANCIKNINNWDKIRRYIPVGLKYISFGRNFNMTWNKNILPDTIETISFHSKSKFNYNLNKMNLPPNLKKIFFNYAYNKSIDNLPDTIEVISFCKNSRFNQVIRKYPKNLREIHFGNSYNKLLDLPSSVEYLHFSDNSAFNNIITVNLLFSKLRDIWFGKLFNCVGVVDMFLQCRYIHSIKFNNNSFFNCPISFNCSNIGSLSFGKYFNSSLVGLETCHKLKYIKFYSKSRFDQLLVFPPYLEMLYLPKKYKQIIELPLTVVNKK
jgi:hypothetical protein